MYSKIFSFSGFTFEIVSETPIIDTDKFSKYKSTLEPEFTIVLYQSKLPEKPNNSVFTSRNHECFSSDGKYFYYSSYFSFTKECYINYACYIYDGSSFELYIDYEDGLWDSMIFEALNIPSMLIDHDAFMLHSSVIEYKGRAILFTAKKQIGKSTQASLWKKFAEAKIINGDKISLKFIDGKVYSCGTPYCGSSDINENVNLPVKAIIYLKQGKDNTVRKLEGAEAFVRILEGVLYNPEIFSQTHKVSELVEDVITNVPVYSFSCTPDENAVKVLMKILY